jgi:hypothetical protein
LIPAPLRARRRRRPQDGDEDVALESAEFWVAFCDAEDLEPELLRPFLPRLIPLLLDKMVFEEYDEEVQVCVCVFVCVGGGQGPSPSPAPAPGFVRACFFLAAIAFGKAATAASAAACHGAAGRRAWGEGRGLFQRARPRAQDSAKLSPPALARAARGPP